MAKQSKVCVQSNSAEIIQIYYQILQLWKGTVTHWGHSFHKAVGSKKSTLVVCLLMELSCVGCALPLLCWIATSGGPSQKFCQNSWYTKPESGVLFPRPSGPNIHLIKIGVGGLSINDITKFGGPAKNNIIWYWIIINTQYTDMSGVFG